MMRSPLMIGADMPGMDEFTLSLLTNSEALEINQNSTNAREVFASGDTIIWSAENPVTKINYVAFFNHNDTISKTFSVNISELGLNNSDKYSAYNIWAKKELPNFTDIIKVEVEPHGTVLLKLIQD